MGGKEETNVLAFHYINLSLLYPGTGIYFPAFCNIFNCKNRSGVYNVSQMNRNNYLGINTLEP